MKRNKNHIVDLLFVLVLFGIFALSALVLVSIGADVYQHTVSNMQTNYEVRTASSYLVEKMRQHNTVSITTLDDQTVLCFEDDNSDTVTYLYCYEDYLRELYTRDGSDLGGNILKAGQKIVPVKDLIYEQISPSMIKTTIQASDENSQTVYLHSFGGN